MIETFQKTGSGPRTLKTTYRVFDSVEELIEGVEQVDEQRCEEYRPTTGFRAKFLGRSFDGWAEAYQAAREPWDEGLEVLGRMLDDLDGANLPKPTSRRRKTRFAEDDGDELDYDRLRTGQPFWRQSRRQNSRGPATITIIVDVAANCSTEHLDILWRGAAAVAATEKLEAAGYRVELWLIGCTDGVWKGGHTGVTAVCLKRPGDPLDTSTLISAVSGWFFRSILFRSWCMGTRAIVHCLGHSRPPSQDDLDQITPDQNRMVIDGAFSYSAAVELVRGKLAELTTT